MAYKPEYPVLNSDKKEDSIEQWTRRQEDRIEKGIENAIKQATNIKVFPPTQLNGTSLTIPLNGDWKGATVVQALVRHPNGGHWVGIGAVTSIQQNADRTNCTITVDGFYRDQEAVVVVAK